MRSVSGTAKRGKASKKKQKRLDAICENEFNRNHVGERSSNNDNNNNNNVEEVRRSTRVRRAPVVLDASPTPPKKRRRVGKNGRSGNASGKESGGGSEMVWSTRLRSKRKNVGGGSKGERESRSRSRKRKLFDEDDEVEEDGGVDVIEDEEEKVEEEGGVDEDDEETVVKKTPGRNEGSDGSGDGSEEEVDENENENENDEGEWNLDSEREAPDAVDEREDGKTENGCGENMVDELVTTERCDIEVDLQLGVNQSEEERNNEEAVGLPSRQVENGECRDENDESLVKGGEKSLEDDRVTRRNRLSCDLGDTVGNLRLKEGRRCGLCGGGTDGKPPKKLTREFGESENETCSGSSASEEPTYDIWDGFGDEPDWLGRLLGPINDRYGIAGIWVHQHCAVWSPEVYFAGVGCLKNVRTALCRGKALKCTRCDRRGATIGCRVDRCPKTYHLPCARVSGCIFDHRKFLIACTDHRHLFQPHGSHYLSHMKKLKTKKKKLEVRKCSNDAWRKDIEAEEKWLENCGEDEEFLKRESKRLHRDLLRIAPEYIGGSQSEGGKHFEGWESVAGLQDVIRCMKEVVILPLLYPEFFDNLGMTPPRGVLLHGYPGTGKTLVVRALIGSCARGDRRIAYFARKGADCLGKYVGDAERQLRLLFQVAEKCQPSIIFFDEIDGLAPCRTRQQDQTHSSVVSTLLALMDGVKSRGSVMVIGATNRPDAIDPALRRPGRFDREIHFPLPSTEDRAAILSLHTTSWPKPLSGFLLKWIAKKTVGFAGADLQALCTQAAMIALKRNFPLHEVLSTAGENTACGKLPLPAFSVEERDWLEAFSCAPPPCSHREAGIAAADVVSCPLPTYIVPGLLQPLSQLLVSLYLDERLRLPNLLSRAATLIKNVLVSALDKKQVPSDHWWVHIEDLLQEVDVMNDIEMKLLATGIISGKSCLLGFDTDNGDPGGSSARYEYSALHDFGARPSLLRNASSVSNKKSGFRILISGDPRFGQRLLASCLLHCFVGDVEIQKVDLATASQEGHGDMLQGMTQILKKCASMRSCLVFMPRIDLWAVGIQHARDYESSEDDKSCCSDIEVIDKAEASPSHPSRSPCVIDQNVAQSASHAWTLFMEQVESMCVSTSLMILATSEIPYLKLPQKVRQFFKSEWSRCRHFTASNTVPQFSVQVDGNFNHEKVKKLSSTELSRDVIQQFVQLIYQKNHVSGNSIELKRMDVNNCHVGANNYSEQQHRKADVHEGPKVTCADDGCIRGQSACNRSWKGKSNLMLAISTFGYQILRYPHFAELCLVTSKLKEGPCADVCGPLKGWPFNYCTIRPAVSLEKVAPVGSSSMKSKERSGTVRGLVAVGLSAYRGMYGSLREVCLEVRRVLELLVEQINIKVQSGKDRYRYARLLSQIAYLEDMVYSWAHTLQNLEIDAPKVVGSPRINAVDNSNGHYTHVNVSAQSEQCELGVPAGNSNEEVRSESVPAGNSNEEVRSESVPAGNSKEEVRSESVPAGNSNEEVRSDTPIRAAGNSECNGLDKDMGCSSVPISRETAKQAYIPDDTVMDRDTNGVAVETVLNGDNTAMQTLAQAILEDAQINPRVERDRFLNVLREPGVSIKDADKNIVDLSSSTTGTGFMTDDGKSDPQQHIAQVNNGLGSYMVCSYTCCSECVVELHSLVQKILSHKWESKRALCTVEDVHEVVSSLLANLLSTVGKVSEGKVTSTSVNKKSKYENRLKLFGCPERQKCLCRGSENKTVALAECSCHSVGSEGITLNSSSNIPLGIDFSFVFKNGVLVPVDPNDNVSFHCKFDNLCLCSLIESLASA